MIVTLYEKYFLFQHFDTIYYKTESGFECYILQFARQIMFMIEQQEQ